MNIKTLTKELNNFIKEKAEDRGVCNNVAVLLEENEVDKIVYSVTRGVK